jgi:hypothetical protein
MRYKAETENAARSRKAGPARAARKKSVDLHRYFGACAENVGKNGVRQNTNLINQWRLNERIRRKHVCGFDAPTIQPRHSGQGLA